VLALALAAGVLAPSLAHAVCSVSACDAAALTANAACCTASTCTIDGTLTVSGATCTFDFGARNLTVSGQVAAQGKTITLRAKSVKVTGLVDVRGPGGAAAGNVTIVTTGMTAVAYSQEGGTSAIINASSSNGPGGRITIQADGMVSFAKGSVTADGAGTGTGGTIDVQTTAGDVSVQIPITASSPTTTPVPNGSIAIMTPANLTVGGSGRLVSDLGTIDLDASTGAATFADGSVVQANLGGGTITLTAGSVTAFGEFRADGDDGTVELHAVSGPMLLQRLSQGITVGPGFQSVELTTESTGAAGLLTADMPILANGAEVEIDSSGSIVVSKKIETTGILDSEAGDVTLDAIDDVHVTKAIVLADTFGEGDLSIDARDVLIEGNLDLRGGLETSGGHVGIDAERDLSFQGDIFVNVSGADSSDAGSIDLQAGRNITVGSSVEFIADGSPIGAGGSIVLLAGEAFSEHLPGDVVFQGDIKANGHLTGAFAGGSMVVIQGCNITVPAGAVFDITGDAHSTNKLTARTSLTVGGQLKATEANVLEFASGAAVSLTGSFTPARSAGACVNGTITANGCQRSVCTGPGPDMPVGCLYACPSCGDNVTTFPETCEIGSGGPFCNGLELCDARCRERTCDTPNTCATPVCDAQSGTCGITPKANDTPCDNDANICTGIGTCSAGVCRLTPGSVLQCNDQNPCTGNPQTGADTCDPVTGCNNTPLNGPRAGCTDANFCNGSETCVAGQCQSGSLPCTPPQVCNAATQQCEGPQPCQGAGDCADDGNPCTDTVCDAGFCMNPPSSGGTSCDDGNLCNGVRTCDGNGICQQPTAPVVCDDDDICTVDGCNQLTGACIFTPTAGCCSSADDCNDNDECTVDTCGPSNTCSWPPVVCDDADPCTADQCDTQTGCFATPIPGCQLCNDVSVCADDADPCTDKACVGGRCAQVGNPMCCNTPADCLDIDRNPCTDNGTTCINNRCATPVPLTGTACGTACNPATCQSGTCVLDPPMNCSDNNPCTTDLCTDDQGCTHTHIAACCFTSGECNDSNACTTDTCDLDRNGCDNLVTDETCVPCTGSGPFECGPRCSTACQGGRCVEASPECVTDANPCTICDPTNGCTSLDGTTAAGCDDGQACNGAEQCVAGVCTSPGNADCDDDDPCTDDGCTDPQGCTHTDKGSFDGIRCRLDGMVSRFQGAPADQVNAKLRKRSLARLAAIRKKVDRAENPPRCSKAKSFLGGAAKQLRGLQKSVNRLAGRQIDATLATEIASLAGEAATHADAVRNGLGC
jgi:hypothetical protein